MPNRTRRLVTAIAALLALALAPAATAQPAAPVAAQAPGSVRLMAVGDVMLARTIGRRIRLKGAQVPFRHVAATLAAADITVANLECAISARGTREQKAFTFRAPPKAADSLALAGIDVVSLANNHALDYGLVAMRDTMALLRERGIKWAGAGENEAQARAPLIVERNGLRIAFLAYLKGMGERSSSFRTRMWEAGPNKAGVALTRIENVVADVEAARAKSDVVVVMFHFGAEKRPSPVEHQRRLSAAAVEAGASLVIGSHPHVLQGYKRGPNTLIAYSLGNFVFDRFVAPATDSVILDVTLTADGVTQVRWIPVLLADNGIPRLATGADAARILRRLPALK
jgi:poly-gamma-glutamate capsule biosynthesis protein CapA/YwtB (metallophosphatase superfamily)